MLNNCQEENMMLLNNLNNITEFLNLNYYEKDDCLYIINSENGKKSQIKKHGDNKFNFEIEKDGDILGVEFSTDYISIRKNKKCMFMDNNSLYFASLEDDEKSYLNLIYNGDLSFYKGNEESTSIISIQKDNNEYNKMIIENRIKDKTGITNEKIEIVEDPFTVAKHLIHRYDTNEKMMGGRIFKDNLYIAINEYIEEETKHNPLIVKTVNEMEATFPGAIERNSKLFPFLKEIQIAKTK